jgi:ankyrin repeat protein
MGSSGGRRMSDSLNLEYLRKEAKTLLKLCRSGNTSVLARIRVQLPQVSPEQIKLADIHHAMARELGYKNWAALKQQDAPLSRFLSAVRNGDLTKARFELSANPDLPIESLHAACAVGDVDAVSYHLGIDPDSIRSEESGWAPLLYACASRFHKLSPRHASATLACVTVLLDKGADPNTYTLAGPSDPTSRITAAARAGFSGNNRAARLLHERGASREEDPRSIPKSVRDEARRWFPRQQIDDEVERMSEQDPQFKDELKRRMVPFFDELKRQMAPFLHRPGAPPQSAPAPLWLHYPRLREDAKSIAEWALQRGFNPNIEVSLGGNTFLHDLVKIGNDTVIEEVVEWTLQHGADANFPRKDGMTPYRLAVRTANTFAADVMRRYGANISSVSPVDEFIGACRIQDEPLAFAILSKHPEVPKVMKPADQEILIEAAGSNRLSDVRFMARMGFDLDGLGENGATALHLASWNGHVEVVRVLLEFHAPLNIHDSTYGTSPLAWAAHGSRHCRAADDDYCAIVDMLLAAGANWADAINAWGVAPESVASEKVTALLKSKR